MGAFDRCKIDTTLPMEPSSDLTAKELEQLVKNSGLLISEKRLSESSRDLYQYNIIIKDRNSQISVIYDDSTLPESAYPLVDYLLEQSYPRSFAK